jgi:hypothetical protein
VDDRRPQPRHPRRAVGEPAGPPSGKHPCSTPMFSDKLWHTPQPTLPEAADHKNKRERP